MRAGLEVVTVEPQAPRRGTLLFVHGGYHGAWCWEENFLPYFAARGYHCVAPSLRGHAGSAGFEKLNSFGLRDFTDDVRSVLSDLPEPPVLIGHSMGAAVTQRILTGEPDAVRGAVLMSAPPPTGIGAGVGLGWLRAGGWSVMWQLWRLHQGRLRAADEAAVESFPFSAFFHGARTEQQRRDYVRQVQKESSRAGKELSRRFARVPADLSAPVLVLGGEHDWLFPPQLTRQTAQAYRTDAVLIPDSGHMVMLDTGWRRAAERIEEFLGGL
ncbi:alpha/beta hydrolase [Micromonospora tarensis]|uniref:Alpha/beta hydrolase n=1 Tax=Micromonospora tarensis TaxID=2806100 RepID=A0ABS1YFM5_9ACTN|nr:alpha/beta fold hydrolase [Micromonospora tarensis]MBM0276215.1 alpha/beta hydrolase [Micromonospora tarensis]